jgi:hypothetical protein
VAGAPYFGAPQDRRCRNGLLNNSRRRSLDRRPGACAGARKRGRQEQKHLQKGRTRNGTSRTFRSNRVPARSGLSRRHQLAPTVSAFAPENFNRDPNGIRSVSDPDRSRNSAPIGARSAKPRASSHRRCHFEGTKKRGVYGSPGGQKWALIGLANKKRARRLCRALTLFVHLALITGELSRHVPRPL